MLHVSKLFVLSSLALVAFLPPFFVRQASTPVEKAFASTVRVSTEYSSGSGVIVGSSNGVLQILTCSHVVLDPMSLETISGDITIEIFDKDVVTDTLKAKVIKNDYWLDLALLAAADNTTREFSRVIPRDKIKDIKLTDAVYGVGCAMGRNPMVQSGIIGRLSSGEHYWRCSSATFPGFSGGPVFILIDKEYYIVGLHSRVDVHFGQFANNISWIINPYALREFLYDEGLASH